MFGNKIGSYGILVLGVMLIVTTIVAATLVWSIVSTSPRNPQEISLEITSDEWTAAEFYVNGTEYDVAINATFFLPPNTGTDYGLIIDAKKTGDANLAEGDFTIAISVDGTPVTVYHDGADPDRWVTGKLPVLANTENSDIVVTITPGAGAGDLRGVSFDISVIQT